MQFTPYLYFKGACEAALEFYAECGLGSIRELRRYEGTPMAGRDGGAWRNKVLHSLFEGPWLRLYASDGPDSEPMKGCALLVESESVDDAERLFERMSADGRVTVPFKKQFWGDTYGNFTDKFGVQWAILSPAKAGARQEQILDIAEDIRRIALQEERLQFSAFDSRTAWELGLALKTAAEGRQAPIVVDIRLYSMRLLSFALPGGAPDNFDWVRRKRNVVFRFHRSSYAIGRKLEADGKTLQNLGGLPERDYAAHGGSFPILLKGTGCIGAVTVSGLPQRDDHRMVTAALAQVLGQDLEDAALD